MRPPAKPLLAAVLLSCVLVAGCGPAGCNARARRPAGSRAGGPAGAPPSATEPGADRQLESAAPRSGAIRGEVVRVRDGDSLVVLVGSGPVEVRLDGVDAPELAQAFGKRARRCTGNLVFGEPVSLEPRGKDKYDRTLAEVFLPDGRSLNRELVSAGCAWWFRRYSTDADLEEREQRARRERRGLWADPDPVPPWDFREAHPPAQGRRR